MIPISARSAACSVSTEYSIRMSVNCMNVYHVNPMVNVSQNRNQCQLYRITITTNSSTIVIVCQAQRVCQYQSSVTVVSQVGQSQSLRCQSSQ